MMLPVTHELYGFSFLNHTFISLTYIWEPNQICSNSPVGTLQASPVLVSFHKFHIGYALTLFQHGHSETDKIPLTNNLWKKILQSLLFCLSLFSNSFVHISAGTVFCLPVLVDLSIDKNIWSLVPSLGIGSSAKTTNPGVLSVKHLTLRTVWSS